MANDCRTCKHNAYGDSPTIGDFVLCVHPITIAKGPRWEKGDPAFVNLRTSDLHVRNIDQVQDCPTWEQHK